MNHSKCAEQFCDNAFFFYFGKWRQHTLVLIFFFNQNELHIA